MSVTPKPRSKRVKRFEQSHTPSGHGAWCSNNIAASLGQTNNTTEDCLDGSTVIDPIAPLDVIHTDDAEEMEAQSAPVPELPPTVSSSVFGADNPSTF
ncbi:Hypothetical predicted protein, partial [Paramuricea clavata]